MSDGRWLALGAVGMLGAAVAAKGRGSQGVVRKSTQPVGPRTILLGVTGDEYRTAGLAVVVLGREDLARLKKAKALFERAQKELGEHSVHRLILGVGRTAWYKGVPASWQKGLEAELDPEDYEAVDSGALADLEDGVDLPPGIRDPNWGEPEGVRMDFDQIEVSSHGVIWSGHEKYGDHDVESQELSWESLFNPVKKP